jgi:hypothetical protein
MVDVGLLVNAEVLVSGAVADSIVGGEALALGLRDRRLAALDRVETDELGDAVVVGGPGVDALLCLRRGLSGDLAADRLDETVPEGDVGGLLLGVEAQVGALGVRGGVGDVGTEAGERGGRVTVLARVVGELLAAQLAGGPALVEGVLEHVPTVAGLLDLLPDVVAH